MVSGFLDYDPPEKMNGWKLHTAGPKQLIWASPSDYGIKLTLPKGTVSALLPPVEIDAESGQPSLVERRIIHPGTGDAQEALDIAVSLLENHPVEVDDGIRELPGIGDRTADYLALRHQATSREDLRREFDYGELPVIVQERFHEDPERELA